MTADPARRVALHVVRSVEVDEAYANLLLPQQLRAEHLGGRDAAFATELTYGTLRWQGVLDQVVEAGSRRNVAGLDVPVRACLRLGAYQLLHTRVPPHAAVSATVELARTAGAGRASGFVNAVLRRVSERSFAEWVTALAPAYADDPLGHLAFEYGYPRWVVEALAAALGTVPTDGHGGSDELRAALAVDRPVTHLVARPGRITRDALLEQAGPGATAGVLSPYAVRLAGGDPHDLPAVRSGAAAVQDEGSQCAAIALADATLDGLDRRWLDMCAGPGGKAALLAGLAPGHGAQLLAADRAPHRARLLRSALAGTTGSLVVVADATRGPWRGATFDRVLLDAPCTGLGALRRRPELRWRRQPEDVPRLAALQRQLLTDGLAALRPGGVLGYVTCSPHRAETDEVVRGAVNDGTAELVGPPTQRWPHVDGTDAIYLALLRRTRGTAA